MTARTWCSLWKPSIQRGTELLKYQTQRWIPLQTCSLFFTVGPHPCHDHLVTKRIASRLGCTFLSQVSLQTRTNAFFFHCLLLVTTAHLLLLGQEYLLFFLKREHFLSYAFRVDSFLQLSLPPFSFVCLFASGSGRDVL